MDATLKTLAQNDKNLFDVLYNHQSNMLLSELEKLDLLRRAEAMNEVSNVLWRMLRRGAYEHVCTI